MRDYLLERRRVAIRFRFWTLNPSVIEQQECEKLLNQLIRKTKDQPTEVIEKRFIPIILAIDTEWKTLAELRKKVIGPTVDSDDIKTTLTHLCDAGWVESQASPRWNGARARSEYRVKRRW